MPNLKLTVRWERYEPDLPGNRATKDSPKGHRPFYFQLAADMTKEQVRAMRTQVEALAELDEGKAAPGETADERDARLAAHADEVIRQTSQVLAPYVKFGVEPLTIDGKSVATLEDYLHAVADIADQFYVNELTASLARVNTLYGVQNFFFERLSGGFASTR